MIRTVLDAAKAWCREDAPNWIFACKTSAAGLLALWISYRLEFTQPQWALMTVFIVARKESGLVMTKSFYRILGTAVGCGMSLLLAAWFSQSAELFLLTLALWIGLCVALAARYRGFQSYGFMLAGYTAAIVGFGAAATPSHAFDIAQSRLSEVVVGILCAGVFAEAFFPVHASTRLIPDALARFKRFTDFVTHAFALEMNSARMQEVQQGFLADIVASETQRSSSFLESPQARVRDARLRWMNASFMKISSTFHGYIQAMRRFRAHAPAEATTIFTQHYDTLVNCMQDPEQNPITITGRLAGYRATLPQQHAQIEALFCAIDDVAARRDAIAAFGLYLRVVAELSDYAEAVAALNTTKAASPPAIPDFALHADSWIAALSGIRAVGVLFALSAFWIATAWPGGNGAAILGAVFCILFGAAPSPVAVVKRVGVGFAIGQVMAYVCMFMVLPPADGFNAMALGLLPFLIFCAWLLEHKQYATEGSGVYLAFITAMAPHNQMHYDIVNFLNDAIGTFIGLGAAGVAFAITPASAVRLRSRLLQRLGQQAAEASLAPLRNGKLRHHFESRTRDLLYQLSTPPASTEGNTGEALGHAMAILEVGQIVIEMRLALNDMSDTGSLKKPMTRLLKDIAALCEHPGDALRTQVINALTQLDVALDNLNAAGDADAARRDQLQIGRYQIRAILRDDDWFRLVRTSQIQSNVTLKVSHAA